MGDLKPDNILIDAGYNAKIADFGCSREASLEQTMETVGTPLFQAPELLRRERYDEKVDLWSFACVLESLSTHQPPYGPQSGSGADATVGLVAQGRLRPS